MYFVTSFFWNKKKKTIKKKNTRIIKQPSPETFSFFSFFCRYDSKNIPAKNTTFQTENTAKILLEASNAVDLNTKETKQNGSYELLIINKMY